MGLAMYVPDSSRGGGGCTLRLDEAQTSLDDGQLPRTAHAPHDSVYILGPQRRSTQYFVAQVHSPFMYMCGV